MIELVLSVLLFPIAMAGTLLVARRKFFWGLVFVSLSLTGLVFSWMPETASSVAAAIGVGRGADLVLYVSVIANFLFSAFLLLRIYRLEEKISALTRAMAISAYTSQQEKRNVEGGQNNE